MREYSNVIIFCILLATAIYFYPILLLWSILWIGIITDKIMKIHEKKKLQQNQVKIM